MYVLDNSIFYSASSDDVCCKVKEIPKPFVPKCGRRNTLGVRGQSEATDESAKFGEFPHHCSVLIDEDLTGKPPRLLGGASLIAPNVVLTAAHILHQGNTLRNVKR